MPLFHTFHGTFLEFVQPSADKIKTRKKVLICTSRFSISTRILNTLQDIFIVIISASQVIKTTEIGTHE